MKNLALIFILSLFSFNVFASNLETANQPANRNCNFKAYFAKLKCGSTYKTGATVYIDVKVDQPKYVKHAILYINGRAQRTEKSYPYNWGRSDRALQNLRPGTYKIAVKIFTTCGGTKTIDCGFYVKGQPTDCKISARFMYPKQNGYTYKFGEDVYVFVATRDYGKISKADLYLNGKFVRTESQYKYEWCKKGGSSDRVLRRLKPGKYELLCVLHCKYGGKINVKRTFYVK